MQSDPPNKFSSRVGGTMLSSRELRLPFDRAPAVPGRVAARLGVDAPASLRIAPPNSSPQRRRLWELDANLYCSIIGTCLTTGELRDILRRLTRREQLIIDAATDHDLHGLGVTLAGRKDAPGKLLHKALDRRHGAAIKQFQTAKDEAVVEALWAEALSQGAIPGGYWALLTHPATSERLVRRAFGDVHMLSHLVGASNRSDICRLHALKEENARLRDGWTRCRAKLRYKLAERDRRIAALEQELRAFPAPLPKPPAAASLQLQLDQLQARLTKEATARERAERRLAKLAGEVEERAAQGRAASAELAVLQAELNALERRWAPDTEPPAPGTPSAPSNDLDGLRVLLVGARPGQVHACRMLVEQGGARLLHHDGGIEDKLGALAGLVSRADLVLFPVDCVSHQAVALVKRTAAQINRPWRAMRRASVACLARTLDELGPSRARAASWRSAAPTETINGAI